MANDGWFKCDNPSCGKTKKVLVADWVKSLEAKCSCGGTYRKT